MTTLTIDGRPYVAVPLERWMKVPAKLRARITPDDPELFRTSTGDYDAIPALRASIARDVVQGRHALGWSQRQLAAKAGVRQATVAGVESGRQTPNIRTIEKIEAALGCGATERRR
ncbi:MAG: helix-turn-helix domain-containing protein [Phycisphaerae bacterium]